MLHAMIDLQHVQFVYPHSDSPFSLGVDSLSVAAGEKLAIVGPSGSGKTTLLNLIAGILVPEAGTITVSESVVSGLPDRQRRDFRVSNIGMVFQQFELLDYLNVSDNVCLPFLINRSLDGGRHLREKTQQLLASVGLDSFAGRFPNKLSRGEQQRVAICRALITEPAILLADEPTGNLDAANKRVILNLLFRESEARNQTLIVVTHDQSLLSGFDRVIDFDKFLVAKSVDDSEVTV